MNINKKLDLWIHEELITESQKKAIREFEAHQRSSLFLYSLLFLSSFCIGLGIIAIVAANWQIIPVSAKIAADFLLLTILAVGIHYARLNNRRVITEALVFLYAIMVLASIGLIAQIFQLPSHGLQALLFWSVVVSPLLLFSKKVWLSFFWLPTFVFSLTDFIYNFSPVRRTVDLLREAFPGVLPFIILLMLFSLYKLIVGSKIYTHPLSHAFRWVTMLTLATYVFISDFFGREVFYNSYFVAENIVLYKFCAWLTLALLTGIFYRFNRYRGESFGAQALFILLGFSVIAQVLPDNRTIFELWGAVQTLSMLTLVGIYAYGRNLPGVLSWVSGLMALRLFIVYIQVFGSLLTTGLGLIISGLIFLALSYGWYKFKGCVQMLVREKK